MMLTDLKQGELAKITDLSPIHSVMKRRLLDLDILEGSFIQLKRVLPFGGPVAIETNGQQIGIRRMDAMKIKVEKVLSL